MLMLNPINVNDIPGKGYRSGRGNYVEREIEDFVASGEPAAEIVFPADRNPRSVYAVYKRAAKARHFPVFLLIRRARVFLIREDENA